MITAAAKQPNGAAAALLAKRFVFQEPAAFGLGYATGSRGGSGIGLETASRIVKTAHEILDNGINDPEMFELIGLFESGIGSDRISDMTCQILLPRFLKYTDRIAKATGATPTASFEYQDQVYNIPTVTLDGRSTRILFVPKSLLRDLPVAETYADIVQVCAHNASLRNRLNKLIGEVFASSSKGEKREAFRQAFRKDPTIFSSVIESYKQQKPSAYDSENDPEGYLTWLNSARNLVKNFPIALSIPHQPSFTDVETVVVKICQHVKGLLENNGLYRLLYKDELCTKPRKELAIQLLFFGIADSYCVANNIDLARECNGGRGPVDFKLSRGSIESVLVEMKLSTNTQLVHGFETQLEIYSKAEKTKKTYMLVAKVAESDVTLKKLDQAEKDARSKGKPYPKVIHVDATPAPSASKVPSIAKTKKKR